MNQKFVIRWIAALTLIISSISATIGIALAHSTSESFGRIILNRHHAELSRAIDFVRNDLLQGNIRGARRHLEELKRSNTISDYGIRPQASSLFTEEPQDFTPQDNNTRSTGNIRTLSFPVYFNNSTKEDRWGNVHFSVDVREFENEKLRFYYLVAITAGLVGISALIGLSIYGWKLRSSILDLFPILKQVSRLEFPRSNQRIERVWGPLLVHLNESVQHIKSLQSEKIASERNSALYELATQVTHDLQSPVAALKTCRKIYQEEVSSTSDDLKQLLDTSVTRIEGITQTLLASFRANQSNRESSYRYALLSVLKEVSQEKRAAHPRGTEAEFQVTCSNHVTLSSDTLKREDLSRIISNLTDNALDARCTCLSITAEFHKDIDALSIIITDDGIGIPAKNLALIGDRGFTWGKDNGTGLGLHHAINTIESASGSLKVHSQPGTGTQVHIIIPCTLRPT